MSEWIPVSERLPEKCDEVAYLRTQVQLLTDEVERLRLTDAEGEAIRAAMGLMLWCGENGHIGEGGHKDIAALRGLLDRMRKST